MRIYFECMEILPEDLIEEADFIRVDVTDLDEQQRKEVLEAIKEHFSGLKYILQVHYCYHDEGEGKPCKIRIIEVRE